MIAAKTTSARNMLRNFSAVVTQTVTSLDEDRSQPAHMGPDGRGRHTRRTRPSSQGLS
jgi:hypothetical protein